MKKKNGLLQTFFYNFLKIQVTNWVPEILVTFENQSSIIYWFLLRYTVIIYEFTQGNLGANKIASSRFQSPVKKKNRKLRHWRPTARFLFTHNFFFNHVYLFSSSCLFDHVTCCHLCVRHGQCHTLRPSFPKTKEINLRNIFGESQLS